MLALHSQYNPNDEQTSPSSSSSSSSESLDTPGVPLSTSSVLVSTPSARTSLFSKPNLKPNTYSSTTISTSSNTTNNNNNIVNRRYKENEYIIPSRISNDISTNSDSSVNSYIVEIKNLKMLNLELNEAVEMQRKEIDIVLGKHAISTITITTITITISI